MAVLTGIGLLVLAAGLARPARTDAITGPDGDELDGSVAELVTLDVNGIDQTVMIRGHSIDNPVLLFLAGGPGGSELGAMRRHLPALEEHVTVATWDQRGTGHSYPSLDPSSTLTLDSIIDDTLAVTDYLRDRFGQDTIYLAGQSWGSTLGVLAVQAAPEKYTAFIGIGQMVSQLATDRIFYDDTLVWARTNDRSGLVDELVDIGPPPYSGMLDYETALSYEHEVYPYDHAGNSEGEGGFSENFLVDEYALIDQVHLLGAFMDTFSVVYPQLQEIDFRETATEFDVPDVLRAGRPRSRRPRRGVRRLVSDGRRARQGPRRVRDIGAPTPVRTTRRVRRLRRRHRARLRGVTMTGHTIEIDRLTKRYGAATVLDDLSFTVQPGRVTGFLGPNGAGKSTTMKILLDLAAADDGSATINGRRYRDLADPAATVGVVIEANAFHPGRSGRNHLLVVADTAGIGRDRVDEMIDAVDLTPAADRHVGGYSLGMRQRLGLAAALLGDPPVLILDEPANGLDPQGVRTLRDLLRARAASGGTVLVSSHLLAEVEHLADDIVILAGGRLVASAPLGELQHTTSLVRTPAPDRLRAALAHAGADVEAGTDPADALIVRGLRTDQIGDVAFDAGIALHELTAHASSLEELFLQATSAANSTTISAASPTAPPSTRKDVQPT